jgi:hypothetical protein
VTENAKEFLQEVLVCKERPRKEEKSGGNQENLDGHAPLFAFSLLEKEKPFRLRRP